MIKIHKSKLFYGPVSEDVAIPQDDPTWRLDREDDDRLWQTHHIWRYLIFRQIGYMCKGKVSIQKWLLDENWMIRAWKSSIFLFWIRRLDLVRGFDHPTLFRTMLMDHYDSMMGGNSTMIHHWVVWLSIRISAMKPLCLVVNQLMFLWNPTVGMLEGIERRLQRLTWPREQ